MGHTPGPGVCQSQYHRIAQGTQRRHRDGSIPCGADISIWPMSAARPTRPSRPMTARMPVSSTGRRSFTVQPAWERITNKVTFEYPADWKTAAQGPAAGKRLAPFPSRSRRVVGYNSSLYHEMLTWKGAKFFLIEPEFKSSFSWEDLYSNAMGTWVAVAAIEAGGPFKRRVLPGC